MYSQKTKNEELIVDSNTGHTVLFSIVFQCHWLLYAKRAEKVLVDAHHSAGIIKLPTIVRCREYSDEFAIGKEFVSILNDLMSSTHETKVVTLQERVNCLRTERVANPTII